MLTEETLNASAVPIGKRHVLKNGDTFSLVDAAGDVFDLVASELGLYFRGSRHLSRLALSIDSVILLPLGVGVGVDGELIHEAMNERLVLPTGDPLPRGVLHIRKTSQLVQGIWAQRLELTNYAHVPMPLVLRWSAAADFADLFEVRGARRRVRGLTLPAQTEADALTFAYEGLDGIVRRTRVSTRPPATADGRGTFALGLDVPAGKSRVVEVLARCEQFPATVAPPEKPPLPTFEGVQQECRASHRSRDAVAGRLEFSDASFTRWFDQSWTDLRTMTVETDEGSIVHAGVPWFSTLFGRDSIWTALSVGWLQPELSRGVLLALANSQAPDWDCERDAEPGKIIHELREGEMAALSEVPFGRYYGSIDATPLFLVLLATYVRETNDLATAERLLPAAYRAWRWLDEFGDRDGDGFIEYERHHPTGLVHQGWKDSHDSIMHADGAHVAGPIALCEVQGYAYAARRGLAEVMRRVEVPAAAARLEADAEQLRERFDEAFWCDDIGMYALALDGDKRPCRVRSSNVGHVLWSGIAQAKRHADVARSLMESDLRSGWGLRTLSSRAKSYNPLSYHNGSVWPHDTAIAIAGLCRVHAWQQALELFGELGHLAQRVEDSRLPELICGFARGPDDRPTGYPVACAPQAWSAAACYLGLRALLDLQLDGSAGSVTFEAPHLPSGLDTVRLLGLPVGQRRLDLEARREGECIRIHGTDMNQVPVSAAP
jgi:glycogen debranching enzyme